ncbi:hypothetical protein Tco_1457978 [Tanacetum coccineum]
MLCPKKISLLTPFTCRHRSSPLSCGEALHHGENAKCQLNTNVLLQLNVYSIGDVPCYESRALFRPDVALILNFEGIALAAAKSVTSEYIPGIVLDKRSLAKLCTGADLTQFCPLCN